VFAIANPDTEILPELVEGLVRVMGTGHSDGNLHWLTFCI